MKKYMLIAFTLLSVFVLSACGGSKDEPAGTAQTAAPSAAVPAAQTEAALRVQLEEVFAEELAAEPKLTADGQVDLSGYSDDELYAMLESGFSPNEEAGIDLYGFTVDEAAAYAAYEDAELELKDAEIRPFAEGSAPDDGFVFEELSPEMQAVLAEMEAEMADYEDASEELDELANQREELQQQLGEAMQQLQGLGIDLSKYGLSGLTG